MAGRGAAARASRTSWPTVLPVFSRVAYVCVGDARGHRHVSGVARASAVGGRWPITDYGRLVLLKIALFVALIALGNLARQTVAAALRPGRRAYAMTERADADAERAARRRIRCGRDASLRRAGSRRAACWPPPRRPGRAAARAGGRWTTIDARPHTVRAWSLRPGQRLGHDVQLAPSTARSRSPSQTADGRKPAQLTATAGRCAAKDLGPITIPLPSRAVDRLQRVERAAPGGRRLVITLQRPHVRVRLHRRRRDRVLH